ncbi:MAG TPA: AzlC family ABC transporter permease [Candidatus Dormibacteraeota bacterium]|nr:AzlC family ABC transporter permease [Candidatus Dormibacteraeota bacterium]
MNRGRRPIVRDALAIAVADGIFGVTFGALAVSAHLSLLEACALSLLAFTGASQFALVSVLAAGGGSPAAVASALLLGARNTLYALRVRSLLPRQWWPLRAHFVIDETTGMALGQRESSLHLPAFTITAACVFMMWNIGTAIGALVGLTTGDPRRFGLDAAGPAVFLALLVPMIKGRAELVATLAAAVTTLVTLPILPPGVPVLLAAAVGGLVAMVMRR